MSRSQSRLSKERKTIRVMISEYCRGIHRRGRDQCAECGELLAYAEKRLEKCPFQDDKPPCAKCPIHCYQPKRREQIKAVMMYNGPRLIFRHPLFAFRHWLDGFKKTPPHPRRGNRAAGKPGG